MSGSLQSGHYSDGRMMRQVDERDEDMGMDEYGAEMEDEGEREDMNEEETDEQQANLNRSMDFEEFRGIIENNEDESKNKNSQAR